MTFTAHTDTVIWYGMVNVDLYSAIITKVSNALNNNNNPKALERMQFSDLRLSRDNSNMHNSPLKFSTVFTLSCF